MPRFWYTINVNKKLEILNKLEYLNLKFDFMLLISYLFLISIFKFLILLLC